MPKKHKQCENCKEFKPDVKPQINPYKLEKEGKIRKENLCDQCIFRLDEDA